MRKGKILSLLAVLSIVFAIVACNQHTCTPSGSWTYDENGHWHKCDGCDEKYDSSEHQLAWSVKTEATCEVALVEEGTCSCGYVTSRTGSKAEHTEEVVAGKAATCTEAGLTEGKKCSVCNEVLVAQEAIEALGHTPSEAIKENETASTCKVAGSYESVVKCSTCGEELSRETVALPLANHTEEVVAGKTATCTEAGLTEGKKCSVCNEVLVAQETIEALGHDVVTSHYAEQNGTIVYVEVCSREHELVTETTVQIVVPGNLDVEHIIGVSDAQYNHNVIITENGQPYDGSDVVFTSSEETVVTVDANIVTVVGQGSSIITISYKGSEIKTFTVNVVCYNPVKTAEEFIAIGTSVDTLSLNYKLMNDIDFGGAKIACFGSKNTKEKYFTGIFDGQGYSLMNMELANDGTNVDVGLFGSLNGATIKNLNIIGVKTLSVGGGLASFIDGGSTVENCFIDAIVVGMTYKADGSLQGLQKSVNGGAFAWRINDAKSKLINCISVVRIAVTDPTHVTSLETWYGGFVGANYGTIQNCQAIVLSGHTLKEYTSPAASATVMENSKVYNSISEFYNDVEASRYPTWTFDANKELLPHLGTVNVAVSVEDVELYAGNSIQLSAVSYSAVSYSLEESIEGVELSSAGLLTVADSVAANTVIEVLVTNVYGGQGTINVIVKELTIDVTSIGSVTVEECILGGANSVIEHQILVSRNGTPITEGITYVSSNELVATVDATNVTIKGEGTATIKVLYNGNEIHSFDVTASNVWHPVYTAEDFLKIGTSQDTMSLKYKLMNDIDFEGAEVESFSSNATKATKSFIGVFDGQGYTLKNFTLVKSTMASAGKEVSLFGNVGLDTTKTGIVKNLNVTGAKMAAPGAVIVSWLMNGSTVENCSVEVTVTDPSGATGGNYCGAIVMRAQAGSIIKDCVAAIAINGSPNTGKLGGIVGNNLTTISNCQVIDLSGKELKVFAYAGATTGKSTNSAVYTSVSAFYEAVSESSYPGWVFDANEEALPYVGVAK